MDSPARRPMSSTMSTRSLKAPIMDESKSQSLVHSTKVLAQELQELSKRTKNLEKLKGSEILVEKIGELMVEVEEQTEKLSTAMTTSTSVLHHLDNLNKEMKDIKLFFQELDARKTIFFKGSLKRRIELLYQSLRSKATHLLTSVSLELLTDRTPPAEPPSTAVELYNAGIGYYFGTGGRPKNYTLAFSKFTQSAELDNTDSMVMLGRCYHHGHGVADDNDTAMDWLGKAAGMSGCPEAKNELAMIIIDELKDLNPKFIKQYAQKKEAESRRFEQSMRDELDEKGSADDDEDDDYMDFSLADSNFQQACTLLLEAASEGHVTAKSNMGHVYEELGDMESAAKWYSMASKGGCSKGTCALANIYLHEKMGMQSTLGEPVSNRHKAFSLFSMAATNGDPDGFCGLGMCYEYGVGTDADILQALTCYRKGSKQNSVKCMYNAGWVCVRSGMDILENIKKLRSHTGSRGSSGSKWGKVKAHVAIDGLYGFAAIAHQQMFHEQNMKDATSALTTEEERDEFLFHNLQKTADKYLKEGIGYLRSAADQGEVDAAFQLARLYEQGVGVPLDRTAALEQYLYAAKIGHPKAAMFAGNLLHDRATHSQSSGKTESYLKDLQQAATMFQKAAKAGMTEAMNALGILLEDGRGRSNGEADFISAAQWYYEACKKGCSEAHLNLALLLANDDQPPVHSFRAKSGEVVTLQELADFLENHLLTSGGGDDDKRDIMSKLINTIAHTASKPVQLLEDENHHQLAPAQAPPKLSSNVHNRNAHSSEHKPNSSSTASALPLSKNGPTPSGNLILYSDRPKSSSPSSHQPAGSLNIRDIAENMRLLRTGSRDSMNPSPSNQPSGSSTSAGHNNISPSNNKVTNLRNDVTNKNTTRAAPHAPAAAAAATKAAPGDPLYHLHRSGEIYTTNGPIPPPNYVPKATPPGEPSAAHKEKPRHSHTQAISDSHSNSLSSDTHKSVGRQQSNPSPEEEPVSTAGIAAVPAALDSAAPAKSTKSGWLGRLSRSNSRDNVMDKSNHSQSNSEPAPIATTGRVGVADSTPTVSRSSSIASDTGKGAAGAEKKAGGGWKATLSRVMSGKNKNELPPASTTTASSSSSLVTKEQISWDQESDNSQHQHQHQHVHFDQTTGQATSDEVIDINSETRSVV